MSRERELLKNTVILGLGNFLPQLASLVTLPILTAYLSKAEYGTFDLISTLVMLVVPVATLQIQSAAFRFLIECRSNEEEKKKIISNIAIVISPISVVVSIIVAFLFPNVSTTIKVLIAIYLFVDTIQLTLGQIVRGLGRNADYSVQACLLSFVKLIGIVFGVYYYRQGLSGVMTALVISDICAGLYILLKDRIYIYLSISHFSLQTIRELIAYSWPMVPNNLSTWILNLSDRVIITTVLGVEANAVYAVATKIPGLLSIAQAVLAMAWHENASIAAKDKDASEYYSKMLETTFSFILGFTMLIIASTPIIFKLLIHGEYSEAYYQLPILILAMFFCVMSSYLGGIYIAHKKTFSIGITTMVAASINLVVDIAFVKIIGIWAGSLSTLLSFAFLYYYRMFDCKKFQPLRIDLKKQFCQLLLLIVMLIICFMKQTTLNVVNIVFAIIFFLYFNREIIISIFNSLNNKNNRLHK